MKRKKIKKDYHGDYNKEFDIVEIGRIIDEIKGMSEDVDTDDTFEWRPIALNEYTVPEFSIKESDAPGAYAKLKEKMSKVLAFIKLNEHRRFSDCCTIMPIPTTSKRLKSITGSYMSTGRLIHFMVDIGLLEVEDDDYQYWGRDKESHKSKTYRYFIENEKKIKDYCQERNINVWQWRNYRGNKDTVVNTCQIGSFEPSEVLFSSKLALLKPDNFTVAQFESVIKRNIEENYPTLEHYQKLADEINDKYYADYPEFQIDFSISDPTWDKGKKMIRKIGIRATNPDVSAAKSKEKAKPTFKGIFKDDILEKYGLNLQKDVKSSVPRITLSLNSGAWIPEKQDIYQYIYRTYLFDRDLSEECYLTDNITDESNKPTHHSFKVGREAVKSLHMRGYFDSESRLGCHTRDDMKMYKGNSHEKSRNTVDKEMSYLKQAIIKAEGGRLYDSEIFFHESCIYMDVLYQLLNEGFFVWQCYDAWYAKKDGVTQKEFEAYVTKLVEEKANEYIKNYSDIYVKNRI